MNLESLRRRVAALEVERQAERQRINDFTNQKIRLRQQKLEEENNRREHIKALINQASRYLESGNFSQLVSEYGILLRETGLGHLITSRSSIPKLVYGIGNAEWKYNEGLYHRKFVTYTLPFTFGETSDYILSLINVDKEKLESLSQGKPGIISRALGTYLPDIRGFAIEATPDGQIVTHGAKRIQLSLTEWMGNHEVQEREVDRILNNPFELTKNITSRSWEPPKYEF